MTLQSKRVTVLVTGGIAAYKTCEFVRLLVKHGADVRVSMTEHATHFVGTVTFEALTGHPVLLTEWAGTDGTIPHIELNRDCDLLVVMPASANILAKAACGIADDLVSSTILARRSPVLFVPAMNMYMWRNPATQRNVATLKGDGCLFAGPAEGYQACGDTGEGRMMEPVDVFDLVTGIFQEKPLAGRHVVVTAGPTYEAIDDVRGITNLSSGRQGYAVARAARNAGARVTLVSGPVSLRTPALVKRLDVVSAADMHRTVMETLDADPADLFIAVAAVADWQVEKVEGKIKKEKGEIPQLAFSENPDILADVAARGDVAVTVGFAAEAEKLEDYARRKCVKKGCRLVVGNLAKDALGSDKNSVLFVTPESAEAFGPAPKARVADEIIARAVRLLNDNQ